MSADKQPAPSSTDAVPWLEEELRLAKGQIHKLQQELEQAQNRLFALTESVQKAEDLISSLSAVATVVPQLQEDIRQTREQVARLHERHLANQARIDEAVRQQQSMLERDREERTMHLKRLEVAEREAQSYEGRIQAVQEGERHLQDSISFLEKHEAEVDKALEQVSAKVARHAEALKRLEQETSSLHNEAEALAKEESGLAERLQLYAEQARRTEEQVAAIMSDRVVAQELRDAEERWRAERERVENGVKAMEEAFKEHRQRFEDQVNALEFLDSRSQKQAEQLTAFQQQIREHRQQISEYLRKLTQFQERQKRRQLGALEQELKEIKQRDLKLGE